jgi:predicted MFS family arabinose efflux permease
VWYIPASIQEETMSEPGESSGPSTPPRISRGEWALILVLMAIHFTHMVDFVILMPLGNRLMSELDISPIRFGWLVSSYSLAAGVASLAATFVMDRFDRKAMLLTMYGGFTLSTLFCGLAPTYGLLLLSRILAGIFGGLAAVTIMAVIGDVFPAEKRGRAAGAVMSSFAVASIMGLPLGLLLANESGRGAPFVVLAGLSAVVWIVAVARLPSVRGHMEHPRRHPLTEFAAVARERRHLWAFAFSFFTILGTFTVGSFSGPYLSATNNWGEDKLAVIYFVGGALTLFGMNAVGRLSDRYNRLRLLRVLMVFTIVSALIITNLPPGPLWVATLALAAFMVFSAGRVVPAQAMLLGTAEPRMRGAFMSLNTAVQHASSGLAPIIAGSLITQTDDGKMTGFPLVGLVAAGAAVVSMVLAGRMSPAPAAPAPEPETVEETVEEEAVA